MNSKMLRTLFLSSLVATLALAQTDDTTDTTTDTTTDDTTGTTDDTTTSDDPITPADYVCGQGQASDTYATTDSAILCLFLDDLSPP